MPAAELTVLGALTECLVDDGLDGARAAAAFGAAAETTVNLLGIAQRVVSGADGVADIVVAKNVAGTDDHETCKRPSVMRPIDMGGRHALQREKPVFEVIPNWPGKFPAG
jgi:hypothetical protein